MIIKCELEDTGAMKSVRQFKDRFYYLSEDVTDVQINKNVIEVHYCGQDKDGFETLFYQTVHDVVNRRAIPQKIIRDNRSLDSEAGENKIARQSKTGGLVLSDNSIFLQHIFENLFLQIAQKHNAKLRKYPSLISEDILTKSGYNIHFPQNIYRLSEIKHETTSLEQYRENIDQGISCDSLFQLNKYFLQPCICYHTYDEFSHTHYGIDPLLVVAASGQCYRHEHRSRISSTRYTEFTMLEIVYIGGKKEVENLRSELITDIWGLFEEIGLRGYIETATDPFFLQLDAGKPLYQLAGELKYELRFNSNPHLDFSLASFNICGDLLCKSYNITNGKQALFSGCTALGIDRWVQAFLSLYGETTTNWPKMIRGWL